MTEREIVEMAQILLEMGADAYAMSKYMILASCEERPKVRAFFESLFELVEKARPALIEMKVL